MPDDFDAPLFSSPNPPQEPSTPASSTTPVDQPQRDRAIHVGRSILVQAPAGSGKTDLLTRRFLALLAEAPIASPNEILAITFTRKATAEMRNRILADLHKAATSTPSQDDDERIQLARRALARAQRDGWHLLEQPDLLQIETIDSLCMRIAQSQPLAARLGGSLEPVENAGELYQEAARRTIRNLGGDKPELNAAIIHLLALRDNNLTDCEKLIAGILERRDQWEGIFPLSRKTDWAIIRSNLEQPLRDEVSSTLSRARSLVQTQPLVEEQLLAVANYAGSNNPKEPLNLLFPMQALPTAMSLEHWQALATLLLTQGNTWRARFTVNEGFPPAKSGPEARRWNATRNEMMDRLRSIPGLRETLASIRTLPKPHYDEQQWTTLRYLFATLQQSLAELRVLFAERNQIDFLYSNRAALHVLQSDLAGFSRADDIRHLLVDEFQDTSRLHYEIISTLVNHWSGDPSRSVFLVGDPMQSIYLFRQAEVELFHEVRTNGIRNGDDSGLPLETLTLSVNFRSHSLLTDPLNQIFDPVFAADVTPHASQVEFTPSTAHTAEIETIHKPALQIHPQLLDARNNQPTSGPQLDPRHSEAELVADILQKHWPRIEEARQNNTEYRIAVLVRTRGLLAAIAPTLRRRGIPYRAVEIESLAERQELLDLMSLVRALLLPMDRIAWLSILRAPWCGLTIAAFHILTGSDDSNARRQPMLSLIEQNLPQLNPEARQRLERTLSILRRALESRPRQSQIGSFAEWIERTWRALGGPLCLNATELENAEVFFSLLDTVSSDGAQILNGEFQKQLEGLYAQPDPAVSETCGIQLMTIHKAKGLGFDVVIVPALDRSPRQDDPQLVASLQRGNPRTGQPEFLIAPIDEKGGDKHPTYQWIQNQIKQRYAEERKRLFYVACTRARQELHLIGTAKFGDNGVHTPPNRTLLRIAWPALESRFEEAFQQQQSKPATEHPGAEILTFPAPTPQPGEISQLAAETDEEQQPAPTYRRLRLDANLAPDTANVAIPGASTHSSETQEREFHRPEGSRLARVIGSLLHLLLQRLGPGIAAQQIQPGQLEQQIAALLRSSALDAKQSQTALRELTQMIAACQDDPVARWILTNHPAAQSEVSWTGWFAGTLRTLRADRIFHAGTSPFSPDEPECLWIVDYKTSETHSGDPAEFFTRQRQIYTPQLAAYARAARAASSADANLPIRLGLYYPRLAGPVRFDWWEG